MDQTKQVSKLSINDKSLFDNYIKPANLQVSELNFTNLFIWRYYYNIRFCEIDGFLCIISAGESFKPFCFFPIGDYSNINGLVNAIHWLRSYFSGNGWDFKFCRVTKDQIAILNQIKKNKVVICEDRDNFDYVYSVEMLSTLSGKKYDGKRNHINKFKKLYQYEYVKVQPSNLNECRGILESWCCQRKCKEFKSLICEMKANLELLDNYEKLDVEGALIYVDGKPEAFTVGEKFNDNTVVIHIEKANADIKGLFTIVNQQFLFNQWQDFEYVNREQDLGLEGLRKAKLSYNPSHLIEKYTVVLC